MKFSPVHFILLMAALFCGTARASAAPPVNDDFANALEMAGNGGGFTGTNNFATAEPGESVPSSTSVASIWWRWTAPDSGDVNFDTGRSLDMTVMTGVYLGPNVSNLTAIVAPFISSDLNAFGYGTTLSGHFRAYASQTYYFRLSGGGSRTYGVIRGGFSFAANTNIPANDAFIFRQALTGLTNSIRADNSMASAESGEPVPDRCNATRRTLWWTYIVPRSGVLFFSARSAGDSTILSLYKGESLSQLQLVGGPACGASSIGLTVEEGEVFQVAVDGAFGRSGAFDLDWIVYVRPPNDDFANRQLLQGTDITFTAENRAATVEPGEPGGMERTLWYSWQAPDTGQAGYLGRASTLVYTGNTLETLVPVPLVEQTAWLAKAGTIYHLQVNGFGVDFSYHFSFSTFPPPINDHFTNAFRLIGTGVNQNQGMGKATMELGEPDHLMGKPFQSLWCRWQSPNHGRMIIDALGLASNVTVIVYRGNSLPGLVEVARGTNQFQFGIIGGEEYYFATVAPVDSLGTAILYGGIVESTVPRIIPGNLLLEPSFENTQLQLEHWPHWLNLGGWVNELGGADGTTWVALQVSNRLWQTFPTQPGRTYEVKFALAGQGLDLHVYWDNLPLAVLQHEPYTGWFWYRFNAVAQNTISELSFTNLSFSLAQIDAVSVLWVNEPPALVRTPRSASVVAHGTVAFVVGVTGAEPLAYQWFFNDLPLPGQTSYTLVLENVGKSQEGSYSVHVTNPYGSLSTPPATLTVETSGSPSIILQPSGQSLPIGSYLVLATVAIGAPPLDYQWFHAGRPILDATNRHLIISSVTAQDAGSYQVKVSNQDETVWSLPASVVITPSGQGGGIIFFGTDVPIYDVDGSTLLDGDAFLAQLYAGTSLETMRAVGGPSPFQTNLMAGTFVPQLIFLPTVPPQTPALLEVRAWESSVGASYEEARVLGGKFGRSGTFVTTTMGLPPAPRPLNEMPSFSLQAGLPEFSVGEIRIGDATGPEPVIWELHGAIGLRYVIERSDDSFQWQPMLILTNSTGTTPFQDALAPQSQSVFYRARILD